MNFEIVCDSSADLPESYRNEAGISTVPFYVSLDGEHYLKEGVDISVLEFYQAMIDNSSCFPKTSCPSVADYLDVFLPRAEEGTPVLCICLTQKFSGSYQSAMNARAQVLEKHPDAQLYVMDSQLITASQGLFIKEAVRLRDEGLTLDAAVPLLEGIRSSGHIFFTTKDLKYLQHGGRLGKVASIAGSVLNLKPVLHFYNGELGTTHVCRGRKNSMEKVVDNFFNYVKEQNIDLSEYMFATGIGVDIPEYPDFEKQLKDRFDALGSHPCVWAEVQIGATIGVHTGPYPMGLVILKKCKI